MNLLEAVAAGEVLVDLDDLVEYIDWVVVIYPDQNNYTKVQVRQPADSRKYYALGRLVLNVEVGIEVDHKNLNPRDCRKLNLRKATSSQNKMNRAVRSNSLTGFKGVYKNQRTGLYTATITLASGRKYLGSSYDLVIAAKLYDEAAKKYFGEFARLNFPETGVCENSNKPTTNGWSGGDSSSSCSQLDSSPAA